MSLRNTKGRRHQTTDGDSGTDGNGLRHIWADAYALLLDELVCIVHARAKLLQLLRGIGLRRRAHDHGND